MAANFLREAAITRLNSVSQNKDLIFLTLPRSAKFGVSLPLILLVASLTYFSGLGYCTMSSVAVMSKVMRYTITIY